MRQLNDIKSHENQELKTKPGPLVIQKLISNSESDEFDEAKTEWELVGNIPNDSYNFVENCELCNHKNYKGNWMIYNPKTKSNLKIGSECIKRFIVLNGVGSQEDSNTFFKQKEKEINKEYKLLELYKAVIIDPLPVARQVTYFRKTLLELLDSRGQIHLSETKEGIFEILSSFFRKSKPSDKEVDKFNTLLNDPVNFITQKENKKYKQYIKEGETWIKKGKVTFTTLSNSGAYRPHEKFGYKK